MACEYKTTRKLDSKTLPGVVIFLNKMTEGRRINLRTQLKESNLRIRDLMKQMSEIEKVPEDARDTTQWLTLNEEIEAIMVEKINPTWVQWGVKKIEGLEVDGVSLDIDKWSEWPSSFYAEVLELVKEEAELNGAERKNSESPTTSGPVAGQTPNPTTAVSAEKEAFGEIEIAEPTTRIV